MHGNAQPDGHPLGGSELWSYFRHLWTKVQQIKFVWAGVSVVCNVVFKFTMLLRSGDIAIKSQSCAKLCLNFDVFGLPNFRGGGGKGSPKFLSEF